MKLLKSLIIVIIVVLSCTLFVNLDAKANFINGVPEITLTESVGSWAQYGISIDSPDLQPFYIQWFGVENPNYFSPVWSDRPSWSASVWTMADWNSSLSGTGLPLANTYVFRYFNNGGIGIGPDEYDDRFYWFGTPNSTYWVGLSYEPDASASLVLLVSGEAATPIPEPTTMFLLGTGLVGVAGAARRRKKNQA